MKNSQSPSRRTVVKGAAWATPALVVASTVPAMAASPDPLCSVPIEAIDAHHKQLDSAPIRWTATKDGSDDVFKFDSATLGEWSFDLHTVAPYDAQSIDGYQANFKTGWAVVYRSIDPDVYDGNPGKRIFKAGAYNGPDWRWYGNVVAGSEPNSDSFAAGSSKTFVGDLDSLIPWRADCSYFEKQGKKWTLLVSIPFWFDFIRNGTAVYCGFGKKRLLYWNAVLRADGTCLNYEVTDLERDVWISESVPQAPTP